MQKLNLYINGHSVGPTIEGELHGYRLIAEEGYVLHNKTDDNTTPCIDVGLDEVLDNWEEVEGQDPEEEITYEEIGKILSGDGE